uniref:Uncharacterized protein n=1 Tax=Arundo donax TaxID=35708 RepID=A0A0A8ZAZ9_ARUDO
MHTAKISHILKHLSVLMVFLNYVSFPYVWWILT